MEGLKKSRDIPLPIPNEENLLGKGFFSDVHESFISKDYVVKTSYSYTSSAERDFEKNKKQYLLLKSIFGDIIPDTVFNLSQEPYPDNPDLIAITAVQNRIFPDDQFKEGKLELSNFIKKCIDLYVFTYNTKTGEAEGVDIKMENIIFGHTAFDESTKLYFVDSTRPILSEVRVGSYVERLERIIQQFDLDSSILQQLKDLQAAYEHALT